MSAIIQKRQKQKQKTWWYTIHSRGRKKRSDKYLSVGE